MSARCSRIRAEWLTCRAILVLVLVIVVVSTKVSSAFGFQVTGVITMEDEPDVSRLFSGASVSFSFSVNMQLLSESECLLITIAGDSLQFANQTQADDVTWLLTDEASDISYTRDSLMLDAAHSVYVPTNRENHGLAYLLNISASLAPGQWLLNGTFRMFVVDKLTSGSVVRGVMTLTQISTSHAVSTLTLASNYLVMPMAELNVQALSPLTQPILGLFMAQINIDMSRDLNDCVLNVYTSPEETSKEVRLTVQKLEVSISESNGLTSNTMDILKNVSGTKISTLGSYQKNMAVMRLPDVPFGAGDVSHVTVASNFIVRVEDYSQLKSGDQWPVYIGVDFSGQLIWVAEINVNISAPSVRRPDLEVNLQQLQECAYDGNSTAVLEVLLRHSPNSTGTAYNVTVNVYLPDYMSMRRHDFTVPLENTISARQDSTILVTEIGRLTFSDPFVLEVTLDVDVYSSQQILAANNRIVTAEAIWGDRWGNLTDLLSDPVYVSVDINGVCSKRLTWTDSSTCPCPYDVKVTNCACCLPTACPCGPARPHACAPCQQMWRCVPYKEGFEELLYLPTSQATDLILCDAFYRRRGAATGVSCHKVLSESPTKYLELSPRVAVVTGVNSASGYLYGISNNGLAYMVSKDGGTSWTAVLDHIYTAEISDPNFIQSANGHVNN